MTEPVHPATETSAAPADQPRANRRYAPRGRKASGNAPRQAARPVNPLLEKLFELHPKLFGAQFLPLKLGAFQDLLARHPDVFKKEELKIAMGQHARSTPYLESVAAGHSRHDLDGNVVEPVAPEHVHHAILEVFRRRQLRSKEDLRPRLVARIVEAIDTSGLAAEDYAERVRVQHEATNALLDEAISEFRMITARREALARTFAASGKTLEEFADMYGMNPADVSRAVEAVKAAAA